MLTLGEQEGLSTWAAVLSEFSNSNRSIVATTNLQSASDREEWLNELKRIQEDRLACGTLYVPPPPFA